MAWHSDYAQGSENRKARTVLQAPASSKRQTGSAP